MGETREVMAWGFVLLIYGALDGTIDRRTYFVLGISLTALKMSLDYLVATRLFGRTWTPIDYAVPGQVAGLFSMSAMDRWFFRSMLLMALPLPGQRCRPDGPSLEVRRPSPICRRAVLRPDPDEPDFLSRPQRAAVAAVKGARRAG